MFLLAEIEELLGAERLGGAGEQRITNVTVDSRAARPGSLFVALAGEHVDGASFAGDAEARGAVAILARHDAELAELQQTAAVLRVEDPLGACGVLAAQHRQRLACQVVAITGSTGKTTTKDLLHWLLSWSYSGRAAAASFNNDLGVPMTVMSAALDDDYLVTELGTSAPGEIDRLAAMVAPDIGVITCVGPSHLAGLGSVDQVAQEKSQLLAYLRRGGTAILNVGDHRVAAMAPPEHARVVTFALAEKDRDAPTADIVGVIESVGIDGLVIAVEGVAGVRTISVPLLGRHNAVNVLAALAAARAFDPTCLIPESWLSAHSPPMRMEVVRRGDATFLNDAYNANPLSMGAALSTLAEISAPARIAVLGEMGELGADSDVHHRDVGRFAASLPLAALVTVGKRAQGIARGAREGGYDPARIVQAEDVPGARRALDDLIHPGAGEVVLLKASRRVELERLLG